MRALSSGSMRSSAWRSRSRSFSRSLSAPLSLGRSRSVCRSVIRTFLDRGGPNLSTYSTNGPGGSSPRLISARGAPGPPAVELDEAAQVLALVLAQRAAVDARFADPRHPGLEHPPFV